MGIQTVVTCDRCDSNLGDNDYATLECKFEIDHNRSDAQDVRKRVFGVYCIACGIEVWSIVENTARPDALTKEAVA